MFAPTELDQTIAQDDREIGRTVGLLFLMVGGALLLSVMQDAVLWEDGAYFLFNVLETGQPFCPSNRLTHILFQQPALLASRLTDRMDVLKVCFEFPYALAPLVALVISWLVARRMDRALFLWPVLGICLANLPLQMLFINEANHCQSFFWPIWLGFVGDVRMADRGATSDLRTRSFLQSRRGLFPVVMLSAIFAALSHPVAVPIYGIAFLAAYWFSRRNPALRSTCLGWAGTFAVLAAVGLVKSLTLMSDYERDQMLIWEVLSQLYVGGGGAPLAGLTCLLAAGAAAVKAGGSLCDDDSGQRADQPSIAEGLPPTRQQTWAGRLSTWIQAHPSWLFLLLMLVTGFLLVAWAQNPRVWKFTILFRRFYPLWSIALFLLALVDAAVRSRRAPDESRVIRSRLAPISMAGMTFMTVLAMQGTQWRDTTVRIRETLARSGPTFIPYQSEKWLSEAPVNGWVVPSYSVIVQGRTPTRMFLDSAFLEEAQRGEGFRIAPWHLHDAPGRWFDFAAMKPPARK